MASRFLAVVMLAGIVAAAAATAPSYDQYTDVSGAVRNMPRGQLWQSFTAGRTAELQAVDVLLGVRYPCESMSGRLTLRRGVPEGAEDAGEMDAADVLAEQKAMSTCPESTAALEGGACANGDCLQWQEFVLDTPVRLVKGEVYSFVLEGFYSADMTRTARVGVSPHSENNGGRSSLLVSPVYKTKYSQYTFRTRMSSAQNKGVELEEDLPSSKDGASQTGSGASALATSGIVAIVVVAVILVVVAIVAVQARRNMHSRKISFGSSGSLASSASASSGDGLVQSPRRRHPIQVRSNDMDSFDGATWAQSVSKLQPVPEDRVSASQSRSRHSSIDMEPETVSLASTSPEDYDRQPAQLFGLAV